MDGEPSRLGLLLEHEEQRCAAPVGPLHEQRDVEVAKVLAQAFLQLLLADGDHAGVMPVEIARGICTMARARRHSAAAPAPVAARSSGEMPDQSRS